MVRYYTTRAAAVGAGFEQAQSDVENVPVIGKILALPLEGINAIIKGFEIKSIRRKRREADAIAAVQREPVGAVFQPGI
jgi:hypothetical protein